MANTVKIDLELASQGMDAAVQKSQVIKDNLKAASASMSGTAGSRALSEKAAGQQYAAQRAVANTTGASARNFAAESQGLGGLVRLYATFAANAYAAAAAFKALSDAVDTANMVKGLDQLGAASGRNLGTLAKNVVAATNGAISLRDAMDATAKSSAAGLSSEQILRMSNAATKASQALGISLPDALGRISRAISKLEPELLDELGIYTKLEQSTNDYARSVGKSAAQLTDFEKRQAFTNAVLTEAEQKFGKIKIDANPYDQLAASFKNLLQTGLELVNKVLEPVIKLLANSPTALLTVVGGIATILLKQAIPALGEYRQALEDASNKALLQVSQNTTASGQALAKKIAAARQEAELLAEVEVAARDAATERLNKFKETRFGKEKARVAQILDQPVKEVSQKSLDYLDTMYKKNITNNVALANSYKEVADTIRSGKEAEDRYTAIRQKELLVEKELIASAKARQQADLEFRTLASSAVSKDITAKAAAAAKEEGLVASLTQAWNRYHLARKGTTELNVPTGKLTTDVLGNKVPEMEKVVVPPITRTSAVFGILKTSIVTVGSALVNLIGKFSIAALVFDVLTSAGSTVLGWLGSSKKEAEATAKAMEVLAAANENVVRTLEDINSKPILQQLTVESIVARTTALTELASALTKTYKTTEQQISAMNSVDITIDWFKDAVGKSAQKKLASQFAETIQSAQKAAIPTIESAKVFSDIERVFGFSAGNAEKLKERFVELGGTANPEIKKIVESVNELALSQRKSIAAVEDLKTSWAEGAKSLNAFITSALPQDALSKLAQNQIADAEKLKAALNDPVSSLVTMKALANDISALKLFPPEAALNIAKTAQELNNISESSDAANRSLVSISADLSKLEDKRVQLSINLDNAQRGGMTRDVVSEELQKINEQIDLLQSKRDTNIKIIAELETRQAEIKKVFETGLRDQFIQGAGILSSKISAEWAKANTTFSNTLAGLLGDSFIANKIRADNEKLMIKAQMDGINAQLNLITAVNRNSDQLELSNTIRLREEAAKKASLQDAASGSSAEEANKEYNNLLAREKQLIKRLAGGTGQSSKSLLKDYSAGVPGVSERDVQFAQAVESLKAQLEAQKKQEQAADLTKTITDERTRGQLEQQSLERQQKLTQERLKAFDIIEATGASLKSQELRNKLSLEQEAARLVYEREIAKIDSEQQQRRILLANTADSAGRQEIAQQIVQLENVDKIIAKETYVNKVTENGVKTVAKINDISKKILAVKTETANIIDTKLLDNNSAILESDRIRLETKKSIGEISEAEYISEKALQDTRSEELAREKTRQALKVANINKIRELDELIKNTRDEDLKEGYEAQKAAINDAYEAEVNRTDAITAERIRAIDKVAEYEKNKALADGLADALVTALTKGGKEGAKKLRSVIADELKKPFVTLIKGIMQPISNALSSIGSSMLGSIGNSFAGSALGSALGLKTGVSLATMGSTLGAGMAEGFATTIGASTAASTAAAGGASVESALSLSASGSTLGSIGASIGAAIPYVAAALAVANALGIFRSTKTVGSGLMGTLGSGNIQSYDLTRTSGTLFQGPDYNLANVRDSQLSAAIQESFKTTRAATAKLAENLNLSSDAVKNFTTNIGTDIINPDLGGIKGLKLEGLTPEQQIAKVQEVLASANEEMAKLVLGTDKYNKLNEKYLDALVRLSNSLDLVNSMFEDMGFNLKSVNLAGADIASKLVDALGGLSSAQSKLSFVYDNFYSETTKQANLTEKVTKALGKYNLEIPKTREAYVDLLKIASDLDDPTLFSVITDLAPAIDSLFKYADTAAQIQEQTNSLRADLLDAEGKTSKALQLRRSAELKALNAVDAAIKRRIYALEDEKAAYDKVKAALDDTVSGLGDAAASLRETQQSLTSGADSFLTPQQRLSVLLDQFNAAISQAAGPTDTPEQRRTVQTATQTAVKLTSEIKSVGDILYASGTENKVLRATLADKLGQAAGVLETAKTDAEAQLDELKTSNIYLEDISKGNKLLLAEFKAAFADTNKNAIPDQPVTEVPVAASDSVVAELKNSIAMQKAANDILQKQLELQAEQLRSNAAAMKAQTDALIAAEEEARKAREYAARTVPVKDEYVGG